MRAEAAEMQVEDRLLVPMFYVERSIARHTTIVSFEVPDEEFLRMDEAALTRVLYQMMNGVINTFLTLRGRARQDRAMIEEQR
ncbi:MAG TPA: hypothetical protein VIM84_02605 [Gemmatimonadales bacterium]